MDCAMGAMVARLNGDFAQADDLTRKALKLETEAANQIPILPESEPTRSILFRSAAWLAFNINEYERAAELADYGLDGFPPNELEIDLLFIRELAKRT